VSKVLRLIQHTIGHFGHESFQAVTSTEQPNIVTYNRQK